MSLQAVRHFISKSWDQIIGNTPESTALEKINYVSHTAIDASVFCTGGSIETLRSKVVLPNFFSMGQKMVTLGIIGLGIFGVQAQEASSTNQFPINTYQTSSQTDPAVSGFFGGGFGVVWTSSEQEVEGSGSGIYAQWFDERGVRRGDEFHVNNYVLNRQTYPDIVGGGNESVYCVWESYGEDGDRDGVVLGKFNLSGDPIGNQIVVNTLTTDYQEYPKIARFPNKDILITWRGDEPSQNDEGVYAQHYDKNLNPVGGEFLVHDRSNDKQENPAILPLWNNNCYIFWKSRHTGQTGIYGALFARGGIKIGQDFPVSNQTLPSSQATPAAFQVENNEVIVFWESSSPSGVMAQRFDLNRNPIGSGVILQNISSLDDAARLENGEFVLASYTGGGIQVQRFDHDLNPLGAPIVVNTHPTGGIPKIASLDPEGFVVVWRALDSDSTGVFGRLFHSDGTPVAIPRTGSWEWQSQPDIASLDNQTLVVTWTQYNQDEDHEDVIIQLLDGDGNPISEDFRVLPNAGGAQLNPQVKKLTPEKFLMSWTRTTRNFSTSGTFGQIYTSETCQFGEEFSLDIEVLDSTIPTSVIESLEEGLFISAGRYYNITPDFSYEYNIVFQKYDDNGTEVGELKFFNPNSPDNVFPLAATSVNESHYALIWQQFGSEIHLYGQLFNQWDQPRGPIFRINEDNSASSHSNPSADGLPGGGMVVTWDAWYHPTDDDSGGIYTQRFNTDGTRDGSEMRVNSNTADDQEVPNTVVLSDGKSVTVWHSFRQDGSYDGIYGQLFLENGEKYGPEFLVNTMTLGSQKYPKAAAAGNGEFYVVWQSFHTADNLTRVCGQKFDGEGNKVGPERQFPLSVNSTTSDRRVHCPSLSSPAFSSTLFSTPSNTVPSNTAQTLQSQHSRSSVEQSKISHMNLSSLQQESSSRVQMSQSSVGSKTSQPVSSPSVSSSEKNMESPYVTIEQIISEGVVVVNNPIYGEISFQYDEEAHTLTVDLDLSELEDGDEIDLFTFASDFNADDLTIIIDGSSTCKQIEHSRNESEEESDRSVYVMKVVDDSCSALTGSLKQLFPAVLTSIQV